LLIVSIFFANLSNCSWNTGKLGGHVVMSFHVKGAGGWTSEGDGGLLELGEKQLTSPKVISAYKNK
jgi:hypothetical protein